MSKQSPGDYEQLYASFMRQFPKNEKLPLGLSSVSIIYPTQAHLTKGCIVDIETTGLDPDNDIIIAVGVLRTFTHHEKKHTRARITQLVRTDRPWRFRNVQHIRVFKAPTPRYAYNAEFESSFLHIQDGWWDLMQYGEREGNDWVNAEGGPLYKLHLDQVTFSPFSQPDIVGSEVPEHWQEWIKTKNPQELWPITFHCLCDLLRIRQLVKAER